MRIGVSNNQLTTAYTPDFVSQTRRLAEQEPKEIIPLKLIDTLWKHRHGLLSEVMEEMGSSSSTPKKATDILNDNADQFKLARFLDPNEISSCDENDVSELIKNPPTETKVGIVESYTKIEWLLAIFNLPKSTDGQVRAGDLVRDPKIFNWLLGIINKHSFPENLLKKAATPVKPAALIKAAPVAPVSPVITPPQREIIRNGVPVELARPAVNVAAPKVVTPKLTEPVAVSIAVPVVTQDPIKPATEAPKETSPLEAVETRLALYDKAGLLKKRESLKLLLAEACRYIGIAPQTQANKNTKINFKLFFDLIREEQISDSDKDPYKCHEDVVQLLHIVFSAQNKGGTTSVIPGKLRASGNLAKFLDGLKSFVKERFSTNP